MALKLLSSTHEKDSNDELNHTIHQCSKWTCVMILRWKWNINNSSWQTREPAQFPIQTVIPLSTLRKWWDGFCRYGRLLSFAAKLCWTSYLMQLNGLFWQENECLPARVCVSLCCDISEMLDMSSWNTEGWLQTCESLDKINLVGQFQAKGQEVAAWNQE